MSTFLQPNRCFRRMNLICSVHENSEWYDRLGTQIAAFLGWEAFEAHENRLVRTKSEASDTGLEGQVHSSFGPT